MLGTLELTLILSGGITMDLVSSPFTVSQVNANIQFYLNINPVTGVVGGSARDVTGNSGIAMVTGQGTHQSAGLNVGPWSGSGATGFYALYCDVAGNVSGYTHDVANPPSNYPITMVSRP